MSDDKEDSEPGERHRRVSVAARIASGGAIYPGTYEDGMREIADLLESIAADVRGLANDPERIEAHQKSDFYLRVAREFKKLRGNAAATERLLGDLALESMSDESMRK